jgi:uncharacterized iron-regulated protein
MRPATAQTTRRQRGTAFALALTALSCAAGPSGLPSFTSPRHAEHALVGTIWSRAEGAPIDPAALAARLESARFILLGETHDNPDHHRLQAQFLKQAAAVPPGPAVVFEMLDGSEQGRIDAFLAAGGRDPDALAERVRWAGSGWPDFALYRPLFRAALEAKLPLLAAGLPRGQTLPPGAPERDVRFGLDQPLAAAEQAARLDEMFAAHCELMPREALAPMVEIQRQRDARLAHVLLRGQADRGRAVLVAGNGHVRDDGVPDLLRRAGVGRGEILSVGLLEVDPDRPRLADTEADRFDVAVFTPAAEREDPCETLRRHRGGAGDAFARAS